MLDSGYSILNSKSSILNQEGHQMDIISQDAIKLGCSGGQGKRVQVTRITGNQDAGYQETRKSGRIALITRYSDNHCLVTR